MRVSKAQICSHNVVGLQTGSLAGHDILECVPRWAVSSAPAQCQKCLQGIFVKKQGASPCLQLLGHVISEARAQPIRHSAPAGSAQIVTDAQPSNGSAQPASDPAHWAKAQQEQISMEPAFLHSNGHFTDSTHGESAGEPPPGGIASDTVLVTTAEHPAAELDMAEAELEPEPKPAVAGPAMPPGWASQDPPGSPVPQQGGVAESDQEAAQDSAAAQRRAAGPARPPPELLAAAAEVHQAVCHVRLLPSW